MHVKHGKAPPKSEWADGPWQEETDHEEWTDPATGLQCRIVRNMCATGTLCGYVELPPEHSGFGVNFEKESIEVHGGVTLCQKMNGMWTVGFDTAHFNDHLPLIDAWLKSVNYERSTPLGLGTYRTFAYVREQVEGLAKQLHGFTPKNT